jgi:N-acetylmuramic acid 6-phosphate etherase
VSGATKPEPESGEPITESVNPRTTDLDRLPTGIILDRILAEDALVPEAVRTAHPQLERAADLLVRTLQEGGRWFNVGAGTSGRLGVLDAAELPPTFGLEPNRVQAILAGEPEALRRSVEGAEDDAGAARAILAERGLRRGDAVLAISAGGATPFAVGGLEYAREVGAHTLALTCNPSAATAALADVPIVVVVGPEAIAGSTRMKSGLAQKMVLNALSTAVMVRLGRVRGNLMTEVRAVSDKLRERGVRIVAQLAKVSEAEAARALQEADDSVPGALERLAVPRRGYASRSRAD